MVLESAPEHPGTLGPGGTLGVDRIAAGPAEGASTASLAADLRAAAEALMAAPPAGADAADASLVTIEDVQKSLSRSRASVYRYTNTDPRNLNPPFNPRKLNPEFRSDQKEPLLFHPNEVARFARDVLRIKDVKVEVLNSPSTATQQLLVAILDELRAIRSHLTTAESEPPNLATPRQLHNQSRPAA